MMGYSVEEAAKKRYNRIKSSLCEPEPSDQLQESLSPRNDSAGDDKEAETLSWIPQQVSKDAS